VENVGSQSRWGVLKNTPIEHTPTLIQCNILLHNQPLYTLYMYIFSPNQDTNHQGPGQLNCDLSKKLGTANHIKENKVLKIRASPKAAEP